MRCPRCGSKNFGLSHRAPWAGLYECEDCYYRGPVILKEESKKKNRI